MNLKLRVVYFLIQCFEVKKYSDPALEEVVNFEDIAALDSLQISDWSGYLQSKLIAEQIVLDSDKHTKIESAIIRIGQLTGGVNGSWSTLQWVPALVKSGLITQCLPISDQVSHVLIVHWCT